MASVEDGLNTQVRNIEARYGKSMDDWVAIIAASGMTKHTDVIAMLKAVHGMSHGDAHRVGLVARDRATAESGQSADELSDAEWTGALYSGKKTAMRPIHDRLMRALDALGTDIHRARKKGYVSLRRRKQFGMIQPGSAWVEVGLILRDARSSDRLEPAARADAMFSHKVRVASVDDVDDEFIGWLTAAYARAG